MLKTVQMHDVCNDVFGTMHYKEPLRLFEKRRT